MTSNSSSHTSTRHMVRAGGKTCDLCDRPYDGAACPVMKFVNEQMAQFSKRGNRKRRDSSRGPTRQDHATSPVGNRRIGRPSFLARRSEKTLARRHGNPIDRKSEVLDKRSERTTDKWFDDPFLDRRSTQTPDRRYDALQTRTNAKDKSHIQCFVCDQYDHYNTQCNPNPKARKYLRRGNHSEQHTPTTTEGGGHEDPTPMGHMVDATITEGDGQEDPTPMMFGHDSSLATIGSFLGRRPELACDNHHQALAGLLAHKNPGHFKESFTTITKLIEAFEVLTTGYAEINSNQNVVIIYEQLQVLGAVKEKI
ncbi:hypothetical protein Dimus_000556, partial [Dionaea muscipula]